jgi:TonB family protein
MRDFVMRHGVTRRVTPLVVRTVVRSLALGPAMCVSIAAAQSAAIPAPREFRHHATIWMEHHAASGFGSVDLRPMRISDAPPVTLAAVFVYKGERLTAPPAQVSVALRTWSAAPRYAAVREVVFVLDGSREIAAGPVLHQQADTVGGVVETIALRMPVEVFLRVANAARAAVRFGATAVTLDDEALEALRDFASRMAPAGYDRALAAAQARVATPTMTVTKDWYEPDEVDERAAVSMLQAKPAYPDLPPRERRVRTVLVEYVVDTTGRVDLATVRAASPDEDPRFIAAVRAVAAQWEFTPARKGGRPVRQMVHQALLFEP